MNAVKHAFPDREQGTLSCNLRRRGQEISLTLADDGVGIRGEVNLKSPESFGLRLITALTEQLGGNVEVEVEGGTRWNLTFELPSVEEAPAAERA